MQGIREFLVGCGVPSPRLGRLDVLERLYDDLQEANRLHNLTRITSRRHYWLLHVLDSLAIGRVAPRLMTQPLTLSDVGCGAGFPTLPLAWANPAAEVTGIESRQKKADFVAAEAKRLKIDNVRVVATRAREAARLPSQAGRYDAVLLRAVGAPAKLVRECRTLLNDRRGSAIIFYKTPAAVARERLAAEREAAKYGLTMQISESFDLPEDVGRRQFLILSR